MASYSIAQAKNQLPSLIRRMEQGERIVITRRGDPVAEVNPPRSEPRNPIREERRAIMDWLAERRATRPVSTSSVELLREMYEDEER